MNRKPKNMLIAFSVKNFKSIRDLQTLSMEARSDTHLEWCNVAKEGKLRLVKTAAIYGANASGKSNVMEAMIWFRDFVQNSSKEGQVGETLNSQQFLFSTETENAPSFFEMEFRWNGFDYRYGYEVDSKRVEAEWLYRKSPAAKEARLFTRIGKTFDVSYTNFKEGKGLEERTRENALFLSVCAQFNGEEASKLLVWMSSFRDVSGLTEERYYRFTAKELQNLETRKKLFDFARKADLGIESLRSDIEVVNESTLPSKMPIDLKNKLIESKAKRVDIVTTHSKLDSKGKVVGQVEFILQEKESRGTINFIALSGPILDTLNMGSILIIDELDCRLHPLLTQAIVDLFHSSANSKNAQLIFVSHDVTLLDPERFRRDQIWFCEKDEDGATELFTLADIGSDLIRPNSKFSRQYLAGIFGAVPKLAHFHELAAHAQKT